MSRDNVNNFKLIVAAVIFILNRGLRTLHNQKQSETSQMDILLRDRKHHYDLHP